MFTCGVFQILRLIQLTLSCFAVSEGMDWCPISNQIGGYASDLGGAGVSAPC